MLTGSPLCQLTVRFRLIKESPSPLKAFELCSSPSEFRKALGQPSLLLPSPWRWRSHPPGLSPVSSFLLAPGLPEVDKGVYSPLLFPHIWTQTTDICRRGGHACGSCIWCKRGWGPLLGLPHLGPRMCLEVGLCSGTRSLGGLACSPQPPAKPSLFNVYTGCTDSGQRKTPPEPWVDRASRLPIRCLPEQPKRRPLPCLPTWRKVSRGSEEPRLCPGSVFLLLRWGLPGCHRLGAICRLSPGRAGLSHGQILRETARPLPPPKTLGDSISR